MNRTKESLEMENAALREAFKHFYHIVNDTRRLIKEGKPVPWSFFDKSLDSVKKTFLEK